MRFIFILIILASLASCSNLNKVLKSTDAEYKYRIAEQYFVKKKYNKAQILFEDIMPFFKTGKEFENVYYKYAYCAYYQEDFANAENLFKTFLELFPTSQRSEEIAYMRAYSFYKQSPKPELDQTNTIKSIGMMQTFIASHPSSERVKTANEIIDACRLKLEIKAYTGAMLYYNIGQYKAAGVSFKALLDDFPESGKGDEYKLMAIKSFYKYASQSVEEKQTTRYEDVINQCYEFTDRFPDSKLKDEVSGYLKQSQINIKNLSNEQVKTPA